MLGCTSNTLEGVYIGSDNAFFDQMIFKSNYKVELVFMGATTEADYSLEDNTVKIFTTNETQVLTITKSNCLDGGGFIGQYCKE
jgi:hypothetical protein